MLPLVNWQVVAECSNDGNVSIFRGYHCKKIFFTDGFWRWRGHTRLNNFEIFTIWHVVTTNKIWMSLKYNQQDATFSRSIYFYKLLYMFQAVPPPIIRSTELYIQRQVLSKQYCCLLLPWMRWNYVPSHPPDAVCTVLSSWWWAEEPPETCRAIYRNK